MNLVTAIKLVNDSEHSRSQLIYDIFNNVSVKNNISKYILQNGGNIDDTQHIFNEMIVQFIKTAFGKKAQNIEDGLLEPYLFNIAKYLWYGEIKRRTKENGYTGNLQIEVEEPSSEYIYLTSERHLALKELLDKLRSNCRSVLMLWANGYSMKEIAEQLGYLSEGMARKKKSQCMAEINEYLINHPQLKKLLQ
jgi:RNA polymerase sigma factor (sigma-70 family)